MQVKLALLADYANVTAEGKLNILGIFDRISVHEIPAVHPQMHLILRFEAHPAERDRVHNIEIRLYDPDGQTVFEVKGDVVPHGHIGQTIATNQILTLNNLQLSKPGGYIFVVMVNNDMKSEIPLGVEIDTAPAFQNPPGDRSIH
ncbi:MAG TPA: hypothetical protein VK928_13015 [Longimicrobiales bacterium]|nr:hypothetical protein [Longimicrobiales bacterium]